MRRMETEADTAEGGRKTQGGWGRNRQIDEGNLRFQIYDLRAARGRGVLV